MDTISSGVSQRVVDEVKNAKLINGDYQRMHASFQSLIVDMFKKAKIWAIREPQNMFHGLVPAEILKEYCDQRFEIFHTVMKMYPLIRQCMESHKL